MYTRVHTYTHIHMHIYTNTCTHTYANIHTYICTRARTYRHMHSHMHSQSHSKKLPALLELRGGGGGVRGTRAGWLLDMPPQGSQAAWPALQWKAGPVMPFPEQII